MIYGLISRDIRAGLDNLEKELIDLSKPFIIIVDNFPHHLIAPPNRKITLFDIEQRYQPNYGLFADYHITMPLLNYNYGAFLENIFNSPLILSKIRFEAMTIFKGFPCQAKLGDYGEFAKYNNNNVGDDDTLGIDLTIALDQLYLGAVDYYLDFKIDGLQSLLFTFPNLSGAIKITCWMKKDSALDRLLNGGKTYRSYYIPNSTMLPVITEVS